MNRLPPALLVLSCLLAPAAARAHCGHCGMGDDAHAAPAQPGQQPGAAPAPAKSAFRPMGQQNLGPAPVSLDAARGKFASAVEGFVSSRAEEGVWQTKDETGRTRRLSFVSADKKSVVESGPGRYTGRANFTEGKKAVALEMTVEPAGQFWKVVETRFAPPSQKKN